MDVRFDWLDELLRQQMAATATPGAIAALTDRERLLYLATYGLADLTGRRPVAPETLFEIGSISKSFTAITLLQLHEAGRLDLHAPLTDYLPWFQVSSRYEPITLHHLLSHTAGIVTGTDFSTEGRYEVWALRHTETATPPGSHLHYSNVGYKALGLVLETILGQSYGQIIQQRLLEPLGMAASEPLITHAMRQRLAVGYEALYDDRPFHPSLPLAPATWLESGTGDGSISSTAADMTAYLRLLLNRGQGPGGRLLSEESFRLLTAQVSHFPAEDGGDPLYYGYGLESNEVAGHHVVGHDGGMVGYYSCIQADLDAGLGVVILVNGPGLPEVVARQALALLRAAYAGEEPALPPAPEPARIENAADYAGLYHAGGAHRAGQGAETLALEARGQALRLRLGGRPVALERRGEDCFYVPHPDYERFLLRFGRQEGQVVEASHGAEWYAHERYAGPAAVEHPAHWAAYTGHYRCYNPWYPNFRIVLRRGRLLLIDPNGDEETLLPLAEEGHFVVGADEPSPERIRFDTIVDGQALHTNLSNCDYYRTFTP